MLTPEERYSLALREQDASRPMDDMELITVELLHQGLSAPIRVVNDRESHNLTLEPTAPENGGETVTFEAFPFAIAFPSVQEGRPPTIQLEIANASPKIEQEIDRAVESNQGIVCNVRTWLKSDPSTPAMRALEMEIFKTQAGDLRITGEAVLLIYDRVAGYRFKPDTHPGAV